MALNTVALVGNLGKDPEMKYFDSGKVKTSFSIAVENRIKDDQGKYGTDWFDCCAWGKTAEVIAEHFKKGSRIAVAGQLIKEYWTDNGNQRSKILVNVIDFSFCEKKGG